MPPMAQRAGCVSLIPYEETTPLTPFFKGEFDFANSIRNVPTIVASVSSETGPSNLEVNSVEFLLSSFSH